MMVHDCSCPHGMRCGRLGCVRDLPRVAFPSLSLMKRGEPLQQGGGACYCDGSCHRGERCAAWPDGKPTQSTLPQDSSGRGIRRWLEANREPEGALAWPPEPVLPWPEGWPRPRIKPVGGGKYRCFIPASRGNHEGFGNTPTRAWNACVNHLTH
jgi:hypothetical protein